APGFVAHRLAREELVERNRLVLGPESARRAEVRNATLRGNSGTGERCDRPRRRDQLLQFVDGGLQIRRDHVCLLPSILLEGDAKRPPPKEVTTDAISAHHAARAQPRSSARFLLQQAGAQGGPPAGRREEPLHPGVPGGAGGRRPRRGEQAHWPRRTI